MAPLKAERVVNASVLLHLALAIQRRRIFAPSWNIENHAGAVEPVRSGDQLCLLVRVQGRVFVPEGFVEVKREAAVRRPFISAKPGPEQRGALAVVLQLSREPGGR